MAPTHTLQPKKTMSVAQDPVEVLASRLGDNPSDIEKASRVLLEIQAQVHRMLFAAPNILGVVVNWPTPNSYHVAALKFSFRVKGGGFKRWHIQYALDGRQPENIKFNGRRIPTSAAVPEAATLIAFASNRH